MSLINVVIATMRHERWTGRVTTKVLYYVKGFIPLHTEIFLCHVGHLSTALQMLHYCRDKRIFLLDMKQTHCLLTKKNVIFNTYAPSSALIIFTPYALTGLQKIRKIL